MSISVRFAIPTNDQLIITIKSGIFYLFPALMFVCVRGVDFAYFTIFLLDFGNVPTVWYFCFAFPFISTPYT